MNNVRQDCNPEVDYYKEKLQLEHEKLLMMREKCKRLTEAVIALSNMLKVDMDEKEKFYPW